MERGRTREREDKRENHGQAGYTHCGCTKAPSLSVPSLTEALNGFANQVLEEKSQKSLEEQAALHLREAAKVLCRSCGLCCRVMSIKFPNLDRDNPDLYDLFRVWGLDMEHIGDNTHVHFPIPCQHWRDGSDGLGERGCNLYGTGLRSKICRNFQCINLKLMGRHSLLGQALMTNDPIVDPEELLHERARRRKEEDKS